jgi:hypothetical protein
MEIHSAAQIRTGRRSTPISAKPKLLRIRAPLRPSVRASERLSHMEGAATRNRAKMRVTWCAQALQVLRQNLFEQCTPGTAYDTRRSKERQEVQRCRHHGRQLPGGVRQERPRYAKIDRRRRRGWLIDHLPKPLANPIATTTSIHRSQLHKHESLWVIPRAMRSKAIHWCVL